MPSLEFLQNYQKGKLLHGLFPEEMPGFIKFLHVCGDKIVNEPAILKVILLSFPDSRFFEWKKVANEINKAIDTYGDQLNSNSHLFGYEIFDYFRGSYTIHCLRSYTSFYKSNDKFRMMVHVLFS